MGVRECGSVGLRRRGLAGSGRGGEVRGEIVGGGCGQSVIQHLCSFKVNPHLCSYEFQFHLRIVLRTLITLVIHHYVEWSRAQSGVGGRSSVG